MTVYHRPFTLRSGVELRTRLALAPMTNTQSHSDGTLGDDELRWLVRRAAGGFGLISTCAAYVSDEGKAWDGQLGIASDDHVAGLTRLASALHEQNVAAIVQLHHGGAKADLAPELKLSTVDGEGVRGATRADLDRVIDDFVAAALRAQRAGFDGVEIHGANGYLFTQFLAPADNPRTDAYGQAIQGRARLLRRTVRAVREAVGDEFAVGVRLSPVDTWTRRGLQLEHSVWVAKWLVADGAEFIHLSLRDASGPAPFEEESPIVATAFREALPDDIPILAAGNIWAPADLQSADEAGIDIAVVARVAIGNPDWADEVDRPTYEPLRPPWSLEHLRAAGVGEAFCRYISGFGGLVEGATPAR